MLFRPEKWHFAKGLDHGFCKKIDLFLIRFFLSKKKQKKTFFDILNKKEPFLDLKSQVSKQSKKIDIFQRVLVLVFFKKSTFSSYFFF